MNSRKLKAAILGFGCMGHTHAAQYAAQNDVELVAVCDIDPAQLEKDDIELNLGNNGSTDTKSLRKYLSYEKLLKGEPDLDYIDICLPSDLHARYAIRAMRDGYHVLCEKPMALNCRDANRMIKVAEETGKFLMIAQCLRFAEDYAVIKQAVESGEYGKLLRLDMRRLSGFPRSGWFRDVKRSGGALLDLHLHDADFMLYLLGKPAALQSFGVTIASGGIDESITHYFYPNGPFVSAEGSWARGQFEYSLAAVFEQGTLMLKGGKVLLYQPDKPMQELPLPGKGSPYFHEIAYFAECVLKKRRPEIATPESTRDSIALIFQEEKSVATGRKVSIR